MVSCINRINILTRDCMVVMGILFLYSLLIQPSCLWAGQLLGIRPVIVDGVNGVEIQSDSPMTYTYYRIPGQMVAALDVADLNVSAAEPLVVMQKGGFLNVSLDSVYIARMPVGRITFELERESDITVIASPDKKRLVVRLVNPPPMVPPVQKLVDNNVSNKSDLLGVISAPHNPDVIKQEGQYVRPTKSSDKITSTVPVANSSSLQKRETLSVDGIIVGNSGVEITATGKITEYRQMVLEQPVRLVVDIPGAIAALRTKIISVRKHGINRIRVGSYPAYTRIVLDADDATSFSRYTIVPTETGLMINLVTPAK